MSIDQDQREPGSHGRPFPKPFVWYGLALSLLGLAVGLFAGLSRSPVIGVLLPLLFGLIGGAGGLYLATADVESRAGQRRLGLIGLMTSIFLVFTIGSAVYGMLVRTGSGITALLPGRAVATTEIREVSELEPAAALELAALRHRLRALGAPSSEQVQILEAARTEIGAPFTRSEFAQRFEVLRTLAGQVVMIVSDVSQRDGATPRSLAEVERFARMKSEQYGHLARELGQASISPSQFVNLIGEDREMYFRLIRVDDYSDDSLASWLLSRPEVRNKLWELELAYSEAYQEALQLGWLSGQPLAESVDKLIAGAAGPTPDDTEFTERARRQTGFAP